MHPTRGENEGKVVVDHEKLEALKEQKEKKKKAWRRAGVAIIEKGRVGKR